MNLRGRADVAQFEVIFQHLTVVTGKITIDMSHDKQVRSQHDPDIRNTKQISYLIDRGNSIVNYPTRSILIIKPEVFGEAEIRNLQLQKLPFHV